MGKKLALLVIAGLIGAAVVGVMSASAAAPSGQTYLDHTVKGTFVDNARHGFSAGDEFVFHDVLKQNGTKKGTVDGLCVITAIVSRSSSADNCTATAKLSNGQVAVQGGGVGVGTSNHQFQLGIIGGTQAYRTARGWIVLKPQKGNQNNTYITVYVMP
jgi:hypothetical protein